METRGRKPDYNSPEKLRTAIDLYFNECDAHKVFPDYAGMLVFLKTDDDELETLQSETTENFKKYRSVLKYAENRRISWLMRKMTSDNKAAQGCANALKQKRNGGAGDKSAETQERTLNLNLVGYGGWDAFK